MMKVIAMMSMAGLGLSAIAEPPVKSAATKEISYKVDASKSTFKWHAKKVTGEHMGDVKLADGNIVMIGNTLKSADISMDMKSIDCSDLQGEWRDKLVNHLRGEDFFSVEKFNTATLKMKLATPIKDAKPGENNYNVVADLTIKGITNEIKFPAMVVAGNDEIIADADLNIDRTLYDIRYSSAKFFPSVGDKMINDVFNVKVRVIAGR